MNFTPHLLIPLACGFIYVLSALAIKRANALGVGVWRISFVSNWTMAIAFAPGWFLSGGLVHPFADYWQPALIALFFLAGQVFIFLALREGDVSVTTPVMGTKVLFVALLSRVLHAGDVSLSWWAGAGCSAAAVALLHLSEPRGQRHHLLRTVSLTLASALGYALSDVSLQKCMPAWGPAGLLPATFLFVGLYSLGFVPLFRAPLGAIDATAARWTGLGALLLSLNNLGIVLAIAFWSGATAVNIVYSTRGLISVVLVWMVGHWFTHQEHSVTPRTFRFRLAGAALMLTAIVLVLT